MKLIAAVMLAGLAWYVLAKQSAFAALGLLGPDDLLGMPTDHLTPAQRAALNALPLTAAGNAPVVPAPSFFGSPAGIGALDASIATGVGALASAGVFGSAIVAGAATAGIGIAIAFLSYEFLKQRASMHTNDVRDAWQHQFIALSDALGIERPAFASGPGGGGYSPGDDGQSNGSVEMSRVIFYFDHDGSSRLWHAVTDTQNEQQFRVAAAAVDRFLASQGVPVKDVA